MEPTQEIEDPLRLANMVVDESRTHRDNGRAALVERAWEYTNAANARLNEEHTHAAVQAAGLGKLQPIVESLERATAKELSARDAFVKEYKERRAAVAARAGT
jgi:hypothetical protein